MKLVTQSEVPCMRSLFKTIERLVQFAMISQKIRINKFRRLLHEHVFLKNTMKKRILYIQLLKCSTL
jgi:hypothetical protein